VALDGILAVGGDSWRATNTNKGVKIMNDFDNNRNSMRRKPLSVNVTNICLVITILVLIVVVIILGNNNLKDNMGLDYKEIVPWLVFMLLATAISCIVEAIISHFSQKAEENRQSIMIKEIKNFFIENTNEITGTINVALKRSDLVSGNRDNILKLLMDYSSLHGEIKRIMILAHNSNLFLKYFKYHFKTTIFNNKKFNCVNLEILIHEQSIDKEHDIIKDWYNFYKNNEIQFLRIRRTNEKKQRSFFGMVIEFEGHHPIGLIGFYKPQDEDDKNREELNAPYGIFNEEGLSILSVLTEYFNYYWDNNTFELRSESKSSEE